MVELLKTKKNTGASSTQKYVEVDEIRDGVIILKNGALRSILLVSSLNFDLKSSEEQDAIIGQYQSFLNSLDFPVQIIVSSRRFNIDPYLERLKEEEKKQENELLRFQISEYKTFIKNLTEVSSIMSKFFYVVIPFSPVEDKQGGFFEKMLGVFQAKKANTREDLFDTYRLQLTQRVDHIAASLSGSGLRVTQLNTEEIIELLYNSYNPSLFTTTVIKNVENIELSSEK
ncbi:MAG: hypothetical protein HYV45_02610 [Candidatus Moranbacteria bacterium]|nr:hypothetical protein [Candidatus Moranbacteria bacterium]